MESGVAIIDHGLCHDQLELARLELKTHYPRQVLYLREILDDTVDLALFLVGLTLDLGDLGFEGDFHLLLLGEGHALEVLVPLDVVCYRPVLLVYHVDLGVQHVHVVVE